MLVEGEELHGDGVNVAVRLEGIAEAGGICISDAAYQQVKRRTAAHYEDLGEHTLKNIAEPVRVWRVVLEGQTVHNPQSKRGRPKPASGGQASTPSIRIRARERAAGRPRCSPIPFSPLSPQSSSLKKRLRFRCLTNPLLPSCPSPT